MTEKKDTLIYVDDNGVRWIIGKDGELYAEVPKPKGMKIQAGTLFTRDLQPIL